MDSSVQRVESALTQMARRIQKVQLYRTDSSQRLERSAYAVLVRLFDHGPQRLSEVAAAFDLDLSTVSRQVRALEDSGLLMRETDPRDRRANILRLTAAGGEAMHRTRSLRRGVVRNLLESWPDRDVEMFADLLERFDAGLQATDVRSLRDDLATSEPEDPDPRRDDGTSGGQRD